jgi:hypothetical protein
MSDIQPVTLPKPPKVIYILVCGYFAMEVSVVQGALPAALAPSSCNQGCGRCAHQLIERARASSQCLSTIRKPIETNKHARARRGSNFLQSGFMRKRSCCVGPWQANISRCSTHSKTCNPCFHKRRTSFPRSEFCYEMSMVSAVMA